MGFLINGTSGRMDIGDSMAGLDMLISVDD